MTAQLVFLWFPSASRMGSRAILVDSLCNRIRFGTGLFLAGVINAWILSRRRRRGVRPPTATFWIHVRRCRLILMKPRLKHCRSHAWNTTEATSETIQKPPLKQYRTSDSAGEWMSWQVWNVDASSPAMWKTRYKLICMCGRSVHPRVGRRWFYLAKKFHYVSLRVNHFVYA